MSGFRFPAAALLTALLLVGCVPLPVVGWTPVFVGVPAVGWVGLDQPDYSLCPVSSDQFPDLVKNAIPLDEGAAHLVGRVELLLLSSMSFVKPSGMYQDVEKTDAAINLLKEKIKPIAGACEEPVEATDGSI